MIVLRHIFLFLLTAVACQEGKFSGEGTSPGPTPGSNALPGQPGPTAFPAESPGQCTDETQINSKILTQKFPNGSPGNKISFQLTLTGCDGKVRPITPGTLLFDIDAIRDKEKILGGFKFTLTIGTNVQTGNLVPVNGKDLFGHIGKTLYYYQNSDVIAISDSDKTGIFDVEFNGEKILSRVDEKSQFRFETYLKFGSSAPVKHLLETE